MDANSRLSKALALEPVEASTPGGDAARPAADESSANANGQRDLRMTSADEFLAAAAKEYEAGKIDQALWRRATDQCGDDGSLVIAAYLRARATALQLLHKPDERSPTRSRGTSSKRGATDRKAESEPLPEIGSTEVAGLRPRGKRLQVLYVAGAVAALAAAVVYLMVSPRESESVRPRSVSGATPFSNKSVAATALRSEQAVAKGASGGTNEGGPKPALAATVQQLKNVGNWNVLVLYATEWTRQEPNNAAAWNELSVGYAKLRQFNDALDAATKAVQLSPGDSLAWRNLGQINLAVDRLPEAGIAFDRALAVSPEDVVARCGAALVAQRQARPKDADAIAVRVRSADGSCPDVSNGESSAVPSGGSVARKPGSPVGR